MPATIDSLFMQVSGLTGESAVRGYENWFIVNRQQFAISTDTSYTSGALRGSTPTLSPFTIELPVQKGTADLALASTLGRTIGKIFLDTTTQLDAAAPARTLRFELTDTLIRKYDLTVSVASSADIIILELAPSRFIMTKSNIDRTGRVTNETARTFDWLTRRFT